MVLWEEVMGSGSAVSWWLSGCMPTMVPTSPLSIPCHNHSGLHLS